jgi:hypothetical protein
MNMKDNAETLLGQMNKLLGFAELAHRSASEDRLGLEHMIEIASQAILAVAEAQMTILRATILRRQAAVEMEHRQNELASLIAELRIMQDHILEIAAFP